MSRVLGSTSAGRTGRTAWRAACAVVLWLWAGPAPAAELEAQAADSSAVSSEPAVRESAPEDALGLPPDGALPPPPPIAGVPPTVRVRLHASDHNVVRTGPGDRYAIVGVYTKGETFPVIAKSGEWYNIRVSDTSAGWIHSSLCEEFEDLSYLEFRPNPKLYSRTGSFVLGGYAGAYAFDRKSNSLTLGGRLGYYIFDRLQGEVGVAWTHVSRPAEIVETLFGLTLESEDFHMLFYDLNLVFEVLPGRQMVPYVVGGGGSSIMEGRSEVTYNFGAGTMLFLSRTTAMRWEVRSYNFTFGTDNARTSSSNIAFTLGTSLLF